MARNQWSKWTKRKETSGNQGLWIAARKMLNGLDDERPWRTPGVIPNSARFLELADIALGRKKPEAKSHRADAHSIRRPQN
jgi:hypothetical protein